MAWDPQTLRRYNSTSPFRLINQVRNELKEKLKKQKNQDSRNLETSFQTSQNIKTEKSIPLNSSKKLPDRNTFYYSGQRGK